MKKSILIGLLAIFAIVAIVFYTNKPGETESDDSELKTAITFSNLVDQASRNELRVDMESAGISSESIDTFFEDVASFNAIVEETSLVKDSYLSDYNLEPDYDLVAMIDLWNEKSLEFIGHNCRMTTFNLMKDFITIKNTNSESADWLIFDKNAIENSPKEIFTEAEYEDFKTLFASIPAEKTKDISVHLKNIQENWQERSIEFKESDKASVISVFFHDFEDYLFIGHMGLLITKDSGDLLFIEKLSFQAPYQAIRFSDRLELNDYLMNKYDISWNQPEARPFILENDKLLEGYRENQNSLGGQISDENYNL